MTTPPDEMLTKVAAVYFGGTISSLKTDKGFREGGHAVDLVGKLQEHQPGLQIPVEIVSTTTAYTGLSENMSHEHWRKLLREVRRALDSGVHAVFVTHGTDSMEHTASFLHAKLGERLQRNRQAIILTGANQDLFHPQTDAWDNLRFGLEQAGNVQLTGVFVAFHGRLVPASVVAKEPFVGDVQMHYGNRNAPEFHLLEQQRERAASATIERMERARGAVARPDMSSVLIAVNIVRSSLKELRATLDRPRLRAVVLRLYHSGTANTFDPHLSISELVAEYREKGIVFFGVTENGEAVDLHAYETSVALRRAGVVPLYDMPEKVALAKLALLSGLRGTALISTMLQPISHEIDPTRIYAEDIQDLLTLYSHHA